MYKILINLRQQDLIYIGKFARHKTVRSMELMMGEILKLLETTFHTNKSIEDKDWEKFATYSDNIVSFL